MSYHNINELPDRIKDYLPNKHAQEIYKEAFNHALEEYKDPRKIMDNSTQEETAYRVAWHTVKNKYEKNDDTGNWRLKK